MIAAASNEQNRAAMNRAAAKLGRGRAAAAKRADGPRSKKRFME